MKVAYVDLCGFRGYRKRLRIEFGDKFTVIDGRNGAGKSTIFDAIEFALTGTIGKYGDAKADRETIADYLWWKGEGPGPESRFVEVGFRDSDGAVSIRRTQFDAPDAARLTELTERLCDPRLAPQSPLNQLCATSIIRDEHIAGLSLDLKEADRYAKLRDALGAIDADAWIGRAARLVASTKRRTATIQQEVTAANAEIAAASRRIDEVRAALVAEASMAEVVERLRRFANSQAAPDQLVGPARERVAAVAAQIETIDSLVEGWNTVAAERGRLNSLAEAVDSASRGRDAAAAHLGAMAEPAAAMVSATSLAADARDLITLVTLGRRLGLRDGCCPLCGKNQSDSEFNDGTAATEAVARRIDQQAAQQAEREQARAEAEQRLVDAERAVEAARAVHTTALKVIEKFDRQMRACGFSDASTLEEVSARQAELRQQLTSVLSDLRILETVRMSTELERAQRAESDAKERLARTQVRFGKARKAESIAQELHDASRRAAAETLDRRLDRVLPLLSELYRRLHPHPVWRDIEYSIRGDVKRFLKLQVGESLNPQFLFSSGQRRATGLAFLLSVNIALAWSRWQSILLDDPVQHVDDFRTVHLAEVLAQFVTEGRQIICAVEDVALADLICRRLPIGSSSEAKSVTLGPDEDGALAKIGERWLMPLVRQSLVGAGEQSAAN